MIITDLQPISIVKDEGFKGLLKVLDKKYVLPSRKTIVHNHLPHLYESKCQSLREELENIQNSTITTDCWTSRDTEGYLTVTCHYIMKEWELKSAVLQTRHLTSSQTSEYLSAELKDIMEHWKIREKIHCVISDSASNIKRAIRLGNWNHIACFAHSININLIVSTSIQKDLQLAEQVNKIKNIVTFFHKSVKATESLTINQNHLSLPNHKLIQQVDTQWNSVFCMIERYLEQYEAITTTLCSNDLLISRNQNSMLKEIVNILQPFEAVTRELSSEKYTSASKIIPVSKALQRLTSSQMDQNDYLLTQNIISDMKIWFLNIEEHELLAPATLLDPRFKKLAFANKEAADKAAKYIIEEVSNPQQLSSLSTDTDVSQSHTLASSPSSESTLWKFFEVLVTRLCNEVLQCSCQEVPKKDLKTRKHITFKS